MSRRAKKPHKAAIKPPLVFSDAVGHYGVLAVTPKGALELIGRFSGQDFYSLICKRCRGIAFAAAAVRTTSRQQANAKVRTYNRHNRNRNNYVRNTNNTTQLKFMLRAYLACKCGVTASYQQALDVATSSVAMAKIECKNAAGRSYNREEAEANAADDLVDAQANLVDAQAAIKKNVRKFCTKCMDCAVKTCVKGSKTLCPLCTMCQNCATDITWSGGTGPDKTMRFLAPNTEAGRANLNAIWRFLKTDPPAVIVARFAAQFAAR